MSTHILMRMHWQARREMPLDSPPVPCEVGAMRNNSSRSIWGSNGSAVELNNCLQEAHERIAEENAPVRARIAEALAAGQFVAVSKNPGYCRSTDAYAGECLGILGIYDSRAALELAMAGYEPTDDESVEYRPALPVTRAEVVAAGEIDDCPF